MPLDVTTNRWFDRSLDRPSSKDIIQSRTQIIACIQPLEDQDLNAKNFQQIPCRLTKWSLLLHVKEVLVSKQGLISMINVKPCYIQ